MLLIITIATLIIIKAVKIVIRHMYYHGLSCITAYYTDFLSLLIFSYPLFFQVQTGSLRSQKLKGEPDKITVRKFIHVHLMEDKVLKNNKHALVVI